MVVIRVSRDDCGNGSGVVVAVVVASVLAVVGNSKSVKRIFGIVLSETRMVRVL